MPAKKIMILSANGFIGSALTAAILKDRPWEDYGMGLGDNKLQTVTSHPRFHFVEGDIYTLIRPFNFIRSNLDSTEEPKEGSSRVFAQFLSDFCTARV